MTAEYIATKLAIVGALIALVWSISAFRDWRTTRKARAVNDDMYNDMRAAYLYRSNMDRIFKTRNLAKAGPADIDKIVWEVATVASWIATQAISKREKPDSDDMFTASVVALVAADYLSQQGQAPTEECGYTACAMLSQELTNSFDSSEIESAVAAFNSMTQDTDNKIPQAIGNQVASFWLKNDDQTLNNLRELFSLLRAHVKPGLASI